MALTQALPTSDLDKLARQMQEDHEGAYQEFAATFGPQLRGWFRHHGLSRDDAEDLTVSCITDFALKIDRYRPMTGGGLRAWVFTLARHALADWARKQMVTIEFGDGIESLAPPEDAQESETQVTLAVRDGIEQLSESDRDLIRLRYLGELLSYEEIGVRKGIRAATARVRVFRALQRLERILAQDGRIVSLLNREKR